MRITIGNYKNVIQKLSDVRKRILCTHHAYGPFPDTLVLTKALGYPNVGATNMQIGTLGKVICDRLGIVPADSYIHKDIERPRYFTAVHDFKDGVGWKINKNLGRAIEQLGWTDDLVIDQYEQLETEIKIGERRKFEEGALARVLVNRYERDLKAKKACIKQHGRQCKGCKINFKNFYGNDIPEIIHIHHVRPLSRYANKKMTDVVKDLIPLCPNCHAVVHSTKKLMSLNDLQKRVKRNFHTK